MGYTHYWSHTRAFSNAEWKVILGETKRIVAKAARGEYYTGKENPASERGFTLDEQGFRQGFNEQGAWRTFPHPELPIPCQGQPILLAGPDGTGKPQLAKSEIALNGKCPLDYEAFLLNKQPPTLLSNRREPDAMTSFVKTEYRPYDAVVVSILAVAQKVAPDAIVVRSDGGPEAIRYLF
jgi:hypothetical protein